VKKINPSKNRKISAQRGATIEEVVTRGRYLDVRKHPKYENQWVEIYYYQAYFWAVITGVEPDRYITMYKSRKLKKEFGL
jgi:hypothetical protein